MPNISQRLGLKKPIATDPFDTDDLATNWQALDDYPGTWISDAASPPAWGTAHIGMIWMQKDNLLLWKWNGTAFFRVAGMGSIGSANRTSSFTESTGYYQTLVQKTGAVVPPGGRRIQVSANWSTITGDKASFQLQRGATVLHEWTALSGMGGSMTIFDTAVIAGTYTYTLQVKTLTASSVIVASSTAPTQLEIIEW